ncbi:MAG: glycosyltransferase, partial [Nitrospinaceae bacterium]|nr:glycosyltransferase [Nitrospinaceae bacterium]NIR53469.1 glycosyltransferase [Nitrospinaceae bacterium]NIS83866.1 glycosyltransferase [Nitrospinaceae bacterium]NIT80665.1 glycosyltransferase [Nitrospinaceae bacterium]NIU42985.1 glycosyltransferase [Nitrospinaceae bacterium]
GSTREETIRVLKKYRGSDPRIRIVFSGGNAGISAATNIAAEQATGQFLVLLDHDDTLEPDALELIAGEIESDDEIDFLYTDEDKIDFSGSYCD